jgi:hypothetical protein
MLNSIVSPIEKLLVVDQLNPVKLYKTSLRLADAEEAHDLNE